MEWILGSTGMLYHVLHLGELHGHGQRVVLNLEMSGLQYPARLAIEAVAACDDLPVAVGLDSVGLHGSAYTALCPVAVVRGPAACKESDVVVALLVYLYLAIVLAVAHVHQRMVAADGPAVTLQVAHDVAVVGQEFLTHRLKGCLGAVCIDGHLPGAAIHGHIVGSGRHLTQLHLIAARSHPAGMLACAIEQLALIGEEDHVAVAIAAVSMTVQTGERALVGAVGLACERIQTAVHIPCAGVLEVAYHIDDIHYGSQSQLLDERCGLVIAVGSITHVVADGGEETCLKLHCGLVLRCPVVGVVDIGRTGQEGSCLIYSCPVGVEHIVEHA